MLTILADDLQELIEIILCPLAATMLVQMNFHELYIMVVRLLPLRSTSE